MQATFEMIVHIKLFQTLTGPWSNHTKGLIKVVALHLLCGYILLQGK